jgi:hypothetical protein
VHHHVIAVPLEPDSRNPRDIQASNT